MALQIRAAKLPEPKREFVFHPTRKWRFDFCWAGPKLALEVEGGTWVAGKSRHTRGAGFEGDCEKYAEAVLLGWRVIRATSTMVKSGRALQLIERALTAH